MAEPGQTTSLVVLPDRTAAHNQLQLVREFQATVKTLFTEGHDFGVIPGTDKPTLLKPGAEKLAKLLHLTDEYDILSQTEDWDRPLFRYLIRCRLVLMGTDTLVSSGLGECNSMEARYRWRTASLHCPTCDQETVIKGKEDFGGGYLCWAKKGGCGAKFTDDDQRITSQPRGRVPNDDIYSQINTILKMAKKRALVDAALSAGRLSDVFTQDLEDLTAGAEPPEQPATLHDEVRARASARSAPGKTNHTQPTGEVIEGVAREVTDEATPPWEEPKSTPAAAPPGNRGLVCADCGEALQETRFKDGTVWAPAQLAAYGRRKHNRVLCMTHYREMNDRVRAGA